MRKTTFFPFLKRGKQLIVFASFFIFTSVISQSIVEKHGGLQVDEGQVTDKTGTPVSLAGNSLFWSNAGDTADFYKNGPNLW